MVPVASFGAVVVNVVVVLVAVVVIRLKLLCVGIILCIFSVVLRSSILLADRRAIVSLRRAGSARFVSRMTG